MYKYASTSSGLLVAEIAGSSSIRKAAASALGVPQQYIYKEGHRVNFKDVPKREGYLYVHNRAISSRANDNWDEWPAEELATTEPGYGYLTFIGKPVFVEHANDNHRRTRGVNIASALHEDTYPDGTPDTWIQVYKEIDPKAYPKLAKALLTGRINKTSMGADVGFSQCSKCGNVATTPAEYCQHIPNAKGARFEELNIKTGRKIPRILTEICRKVSFFEDTFIVTTPADPTAFILGVDDGSQKTASTHRAPERITVKSDSNASKRAFKEITLPPRVDTLSHTVCPTCGTENSFVGDRCSVCNGIKPPDNFMDPDTSIAPQVQKLLEQEDEGPGVDAEGIDMHTDPDLICPECGESFTSAQQDEEKGNPFLVSADEQMEDDPEMSEEGVPDEDEEEDEGNPFASKDSGPTKSKSKEGPDGQSSVPLGEDDELTQEQDDPQYDEPMEEEPGNMDQDTEINPEIEDGQPDADGETEEGEVPGGAEEEAEEEAEGMAASEDTGYNPGDVCPACGQGELIPASELDASLGIGGEEGGEEDPEGEGGFAPEDGDEGEEDADDSSPFAGNGKPEDEDSDVDEDEDSGDTDDEAESGQNEDEDDEGEDEDSPVKKRHEGAQVMAGRTTPKGTQPNPAAQQRKQLIESLNKQSSMIEKLSGQVELLLRERVENRKAMKRMAAVISSHDVNDAVFAVRNEALERQMYFVSKAAGLDDGVVEIGKAAMNKVSSLLRQANPANPAQPITEPAGEAPVATEGEAQQPTARDDVTQLGATPLTDVSADASIPVDQPYGEYANRPVGENRVDVTAPVEGTQYQRPPSETIIPVDVRVGNPDNPNQAFPWTMGPVGTPGVPIPPGPSVGNPPTAQNEVTTAKGASRTYATLRLAKLQIAAGIASGDELEIAASLDSSGMSNESIKTQIETLAQVIQHQARVQSVVPSSPTPGRRLVPKAASQEVRAPSLNPSMGNPNAPHSISAGPIMDDEIGWF